MNLLAASSAEPFPVVSITLLIDVHKALSSAVPKVAGLPDVKVTWILCKGGENGSTSWTLLPKKAALFNPRLNTFPKNHLFQFLFLTYLS